MDDRFQNLTPQRKHATNKTMESPRKRFAMFTTNEKETDTGDIAVARLSNDIPSRSKDSASDKSHTLSPPSMEKVQLPFMTLKTDSNRGCAAPELGNRLKDSTSRFIVTHRFYSYYLGFSGSDVGLTSN